MRVSKLIFYKPPVSSLKQQKKLSVRNILPAFLIIFFYKMSKTENKMQWI